VEVALQAGHQAHARLGHHLRAQHACMQGNLIPQRTTRDL
jgi:hypothetical protein